MGLPGRLENKQYIKLANAISTTNMETIVQGYLDLDTDIIATVKDQNVGKGIQINVELLKKWAQQPDNSGPDQIKVRNMTVYRKG